MTASVRAFCGLSSQRLIDYCTIAFRGLRTLGFRRTQPAPVARSLPASLQPAPGLRGMPDRVAGAPVAMLILGFDTTSSSGGAALYRDLEPLDEVPADGSTNYSVQLFEMTDRLLARAGLKLAEVDLFAVATGPGSFTGIRVGLAAAQGWARALWRPVRGVSVLEAMVADARPPGSIAVPLLNAHRGEFYLGVFRSSPQDAAGATPGPAWTPSTEGLALGPVRIEALARELADEAGAEVAFIVREHDDAARDLRDHIPEAAQWITVPGFHAGAVARVAFEAAREGRVHRPDELDAYYIRRSDAELNWQE